MSATASLASTVPIRRRRFLLFTTLLLGVLFFFGVPWELPPALKDATQEALSRANIAQLVRSKSNASPPVNVDEIFGLLHLVTGDPEYDLSRVSNLDPTQPVNMSIYANGNKKLDWNKEVRTLNLKYPVFVFSKSYCPYSKRAKKLLESYDIQPPPVIIEVDLRDDSNIIKTILTRLTQHSTFPNIIIRGQSIGGSDDLQALHVQRVLVKVLSEAGAEARSDSSVDPPS